jgi:hypothetical protein
MNAGYVRLLTDHRQKFAANDDKRLRMRLLHDRGRIRERKDEHEVEVTREKLRSHEARSQAVSQDPGDDVPIQELTLRSLKRLLYPMKEEIARFETYRSPRAARSSARVPRS